MIGHEYCKMVVFSNKAYNAIITETFRKDPVETGGILLGHVLSNGYWIVMEVIPPGMHSIHQVSYFEYDTDFVNYLANSVSKQYKKELDVLGLWHRHPGSMDVFSNTDNGTNINFAEKNACGAISGLVNVDPNFRFTLRHVSIPLDYQIVDVEIGDDLIPPQYFELKYPLGENLTPTIVEDSSRSGNTTKIAAPVKQNDTNSSNSNANGTINAMGDYNHSESGAHSLVHKSGGIISPTLLMKIKKAWPILVTAILCLGIGIGVGGWKKKSREEIKPNTENSLQQRNTPSSNNNVTNEPPTEPQTNTAKTEESTQAEAAPQTNDI